MARTKSIEKTASTGNVFADLRVAGAEEHLVKAALVVKEEPLPSLTVKPTEWEEPEGNGAFGAS